MNLLTKAIRSVGSKGVIGWPYQPGWPPPRGYIAKTGGVVITNDSVLGTAAAWASVTLIARSIARLPLFVYRADERGKEVDKSHPLYPLLHDQPNPLMTAFSWRSATVGHFEMWGNSYSEIERDGFDRIIGIHPRRPDLWRIEWKAGRKVFYYTQPDTGREVELAAERVFHVPAFSTDGLYGYPPVSLHRRTFALSLASMEYGTRVLENDSRPSIVLHHPKSFTDKEIERLAESNLARQGPENAGKTAVLEDGVTLEAFGFPPEDAQYLETRKFQRDETDDIFGIPVGFRDSADEGMAIKFVVYTLGPRLVMLEQEFKRQLLAGEEDVFAEHAVEGLLRGNTAARAAWYAAGRTNGWFNVDEIRAYENLPPLAGGAGQPYLQPLNMQPAGGSEGSENRNPSPTTGNPLSPGAARPLTDTEPLIPTEPSRNGRPYAEVR